MTCLPVFRYGLAVLAVVAVVAPLAGAQAQKAAPVGVDKVIREPLAQTVPVIGRFVARQAGAVASRVTGVVTEMRVQIGDRVQRGDVLAVIDRERLSWQRDLVKARVAETEARVAAAQARLAKRRNELGRLDRIRQSAAFSPARYDDVAQDVAEGVADLAAAAAEQARAQTELKLADDDLRHARVRAPYGGVVSLRQTEVGAWVGLGQPVVSLINDLDLEVEVDAPYNRVAGLAPGTVVTIVLGDASAHNAIVRAIGAEENPMTRTRMVRLTPAIDGEPAPRPAGEAVDVLLPLGAAREVVTVHKDAILKRQGLSLVYVVDADSKAQARPVELGEAVGPRFVVLDGLKPGETVVVRGNERLRPGQTVRFGGEG